jgi:hypothetical protein
LFVHVLLITGTPVVVFTSATFSSDIVCTCVHGADHGACPMHRTPADSTRCRLQGTQHNPSTVLMSVLGPLVLPTTSNVAILGAPSRGPIAEMSSSPVDRVIPPDPPPPRS